MAGVVLFFAMMCAATAHAYSINNALDQTIGPVQFVSIWYRHGQRAPILSLPGFQATYPQYWPRGFGELTTEGLLGHYQLGQWLRNRYNNLIPSQGHLSFDTLSVVSSDLDRCLQSGQANLAGMFPPSVDDQWGPLNWLPIPMTSLPDDVFNIPYQECSNYTQEYNKVLKSAEYAELVKQYSYILTECESIYNTTWGTTDPISLAGLLWSELPVRNLSALPMTETERNFYSSLDVPNLMFYNFRMKTQTMKRLGGYPMTQWVIDDLKTASSNVTNNLSSNSPFKRFSIHSVKDNTVMGLLNALNVTMTSSALPTATVLFELRVAPNGTQYVTLVYRNSYDLTVEPALLEIPGCPNPCTLTQFLDVTQAFIPTNWEQECADVSS